jgi:hypothetical protein
MPAWCEFPSQSIQDDEPGGPIERQASWAGGSWAGIAGTRVDSSSPRYGMFAADSRRRQRWGLRMGAALLTLSLAGGWIGRGGPVRHDAAGDAFWTIGAPVPIAVRDGRSIVRVATPSPGSEVLVVVSALARSRGPFSIELTARPASGSAVPELAEDGPRHAPRRDAAVTPEKTESAPARGLPPLERVFHMLVREGDAGISSNYTAIRGVLKGVGRQVQIYVAQEDSENVSSDLIQDLIATFDDRIHPLMARQIGTAHDVDGDGRFTILLSSWLDHLGGGRCPVDGFVRVADLDPAYRYPFGNRCDMMYLNAALKPGPHVRTVMAHEYMHAVVFSQKSLKRASGGRQMMDEEGWLDEAIAHLAEDLNGFSTSNIDYRVSAFLSSPERYQLVVDDYYTADLFRSHGSRGSTYLFMRWCVDRYGADLLSALVHSRLRGAANFEAATGSTFANLYRRWSLALFLSGLEPSRDEAGLAADGFRTINLRAPCDDWELAGPRFTRVSADGGNDCWPALGTTSHFAVVASSPTGAVEIEVAGPPEADLQVTVLPMGADMPRLDLAVTKLWGHGGELRLRARIKEHNGVPVWLSALSWEPVTPSANPHAAGFRCGRLDMLGIAAAFGSSALEAAGELRSRPIPMPGVSPSNGLLAVKVIGTDDKGRRIAAWAEIDAEPAYAEGKP